MDSEKTRYEELVAMGNDMERQKRIWSFMCRVSKEQDQQQIKEFAEMEAKRKQESNGAIA